MRLGKLADLCGYALGQENEINGVGGYGAFRHVGPTRRIRLLGNGDAATATILKAGPKTGNEGFATTTAFARRDTQARCWKTIGMEPIGPCCIYSETATTNTGLPRIASLPRIAENWWWQPPSMAGSSLAIGLISEMFNA